MFLTILITISPNETIFHVIFNDLNEMGVQIWSVEQSLTQLSARLTGTPPELRQITISSLEWNDTYSEQVLIAVVNNWAVELLIRIGRTPVSAQNNERTFHLKNTRIIR